MILITSLCFYACNNQKQVPNPEPLTEQHIHTESPLPETPEGEDGDMDTPPETVSQEIPPTEPITYTVMHISDLENEDNTSFQNEYTELNTQLKSLLEARAIWSQELQEADSALVAYTASKTNLDTLTDPIYQELSAKKYTLLNAFVKSDAFRDYREEHASEIEALISKIEALESAE